MEWNLEARKMRVLDVSVLVGEVFGNADVPFSFSVFSLQFERYLSSGTLRQTHYLKYSSAPSYIFVDLAYESGTLYDLGVCR